MFFWRFERFYYFQVQTIEETEDVVQNMENIYVNKVLSGYPSMSGVVEKMLRKLAIPLNKP